LGVPAKRFNEAVKRNAVKSLAEFAFQFMRNSPL